MPKPSEISVSNQAGQRVDRVRLRKAVAATIATEGGNLENVSVSLVGEAAIATLNQRDRGKRGPTDVLSYPFDGSFPAGSGGELVICPAAARRGAAAAGHGLASELDLLAVHGTLHLIGYEDDTQAGADEMARRAQPVLAGLKQTGATRG